MKKVGIITFHASHNYGSVLQAYATQKAVEALGYDAWIINYRLLTQKDKYSLYSPNYGKKEFIRNIIQFPLQVARRERQSKFEDFIQNKLNVSSEYSSPELLKGTGNDYDIYISGSDQVWNLYVPEIEKAGKNSILPYFLSYSNKKKISYASCTGNMSCEELAEYAPYLMRYEFLSVRENQTAEMLTKILGRPVDSVLDPTFLLSADEWSDLSCEAMLPEKPYVLLYSILGASKGRRWLEALLPFAKKFNLDIVCITPSFPALSLKVKSVISAGPREFLHYMRNASVVCTDSFHGTAFAINFRKPLFTLGNKYWRSDIRRNDLLQKFGLLDRLVTNESDINGVNDYALDYRAHEALIQAEINKSIAYLERALNNNAECN